MEQSKTSVPITQYHTMRLITAQQMYTTHTHTHRQGSAHKKIVENRLFCLRQETIKNSSFSSHIKDGDREIEQETHQNI